MADPHAFASKATVADADEVYGQASPFGAGSEIRSTWLQIWSNFVKPKADALYAPIASATSTAIKTAARVIADSNITIASPGATIDTVAMAANDRVLLTAQTAPAENGLWIWNGAAVAMTRPTDFNASGDVKSGLLVPVGPESVTYPNSLWMLTTADPITLETTGLSFTDILGEILVSAIAADKYSLGVEKTGAAESLAVSDAHTIVRMNSASAQNLTVTAGMTSWPVGEGCYVLNAGAGLVTLVADTGVTLRIPVAASPSQNSTAFILKLATNDFIAIWLGPSSLPATVLKSDTTANLTAGYTSDSFAGAISGGAYTPTPGAGKENYQHYDNDQAHTLNPPASISSAIIEITNVTGAGAITTTGFTSVSGTFDTTVGSKFICTAIKHNSTSLLIINKVV